MKAVASTRIKEIRKQIELEEIVAKPVSGFVYSGHDSLGKAISGAVPFESADIARDKLALSGISVENLRPANALFRRKRNGRPTLIEMAQLAEQFAAQYEIGLSYDRICRILGRVHPNTAVKNALNQVANQILDGKTAHEAFETQVDHKGRPFFPVTFINAFRLGYEVGALPDPDTEESADAPVVMLRFFAQAQRRAAEIFKKITSGMMYPAGIVSAVVIAFFIEVYWIVPIFAQMFVGLLQGKDTSLPWATQIMLSISDFFRSWLGILSSIGFFTGIIFSIYYFFFNDKGRDTRERWLLKLPILKLFFVPYYGSLFCRNLSMMWASEPNIVKRFQTVAETSTNPVFREMAEHFANQLLVVSPPISQLFNGHLHLLGESFAPVAETIEQSPGRGQQLLYTYAKFLEQEAEEKLAISIATLNKGVFLLCAGLVVFLLIASYSPLIELVGRMSNAR